LTVTTATLHLDVVVGGVEGAEQAPHHTRSFSYSRSSLCRRTTGDPPASRKNRTSWQLERGSARLDAVVGLMGEASRALGWGCRTDPSWSCRGPHMHPCTTPFPRAIGGCSPGGLRRHAPIVGGYRSCRHEGGWWVTRAMFGW
jgi:hypothetical protein